MNYEVIASGSSGNAVRIDNILIDCGIPFKKLKEHLYDVDYLIVTHVHTDHLNKTTFRKVQELFPEIVTIGNYEVAQLVELDIISNNGYPIEIGGYTIEPFQLVHDVLTYGYKWTTKAGERVIYATDTSSLDMVDKAEKFDYLFIESNHSEVKIAQARPTKGYDPRKGAKRHLSTRQSQEFYFIHRKSKDSEWIELHKSQRFY
ncbi:MBL fold metallo-hydrolase [Eremococcus coleocola]|uniref:MBL fold metallo-hydrolase n=1 Tax=Eremococcus coleocola TaxID=88132 RepID=UPI000411EADD|nr:MBL fold metallo-hydrolase [Eremococcus coleocola]